MVPYGIGKPWVPLVSQLHTSKLVPAGWLRPEAIHALFQANKQQRQFITPQERASAMTLQKKLLAASIISSAAFILGCQDKSAPEAANTPASITTTAVVADPSIDPAKFLNQPLVKDIYTADPSAHVFNGQLYIYPSHDLDTGVTTTGEGDKFDMKDYRVFSYDPATNATTDHGEALNLKDVPWAKSQLWAPDAAEKDGKFFLYFPAKNKDGVFQMGVATSDSPTGPFKAEPEPIKGSFSIDPAVFNDDDGSHYMYFGGIWGGQLQKYRNNEYNEKYEEPKDQEPALAPRVARLTDDMKEFAEAPREVIILDEEGKQLLACDYSRRFFEASWMHKHKGTYYFSYSTGNTHFLCYATGDNPYGPFTYRGRILNPVIGWTSHHSICDYEGKTYLFYHDSVLSEGITHLRSVKMTEITYREDGSIVTIDPYRP